MKRKIALFSLFAVCAVTFKLLTAWIPIGMMLAFCFWVGLKGRENQASNFRWYMALFVVILLSDLLFSVINHWPLLYPDMPFNYLALASVLIIGKVFPKKLTQLHWRFLGLNGGIVTFFMLSNLGVFLLSGLYTHTAEGLITCYVAALPFLKLQWISNNLAFLMMRGVEVLTQKVRHPSLNQVISHEHR